MLLVKVMTESGHPRQSFTFGDTHIHTHARPLLLVFLLISREMEVFTHGPHTFNNDHAVFVLGKNIDLHLVGGESRMEMKWKKRSPLCKQQNLDYFLLLLDKLGMMSFDKQPAHNY